MEVEVDLRGIQEGNGYDQNILHEILKQIIYFKRVITIDLSLGNIKDCIGL